MKKNIITIAGDLGSGKSTTADLVATKLGYERFSSGSLMRAMAEEKNMTIVELNHLAEEDPAIDHEIDTTIERIGGEQDNLVIDSRTAWHWIPNSFRVYLSLDPRLAAERVFESLQSEHERSKTERATSIDDVEKKNKTRQISEQKRFIERYGIDPRDTTQYDLVLDTSVDGPDEVARKLLDAYEKWRVV